MIKTSRIKDITPSTYNQLVKWVQEIKERFTKYDDLSEEFKEAFNQKYPEKYEILESCKILFEKKNFNNYIDIVSKLFKLSTKDRWEKKIDLHIAAVTGKPKTTPDKETVLQRAETFIAMNSQPQPGGNEQASVKDQLNSKLGQLFGQRNSIPGQGATGSSPLPQPMRSVFASAIANQAGKLRKRHNSSN